MINQNCNDTELTTEVVNKLKELHKLDDKLNNQEVNELINFYKKVLARIENEVLQKLDNIVNE
ncbi:hypothetical protein [Staphylococcus epidermidis]|uniref:hypothetical protein n=1 Tax=Staphylococcus epidermidis TaxID=1282 RepID=UPI0001A96351|nr:hypothetical protein [Staphylococcus epidermidis]EES35766.1 hypothetical protein HMPREF0791_1632 [Staphylococcus epidermidis W23144]EJD90235.1 hypothetical protein HMPREF9990_01664 [Staphylococcus epidermidis NIHLM061]KAA9315847.1 hypothetical protein F6H98_07200 [Staphylococcus epidermidis]MBF2224799.1 hypothetical protein [Staphylococcus epidermidis]MBF2333194.1 hypothetical protein [Staphylococcus epidermidis]